MRPCLHCPTVAQPSAYLQVQEKQLELETVTQAPCRRKKLTENRFHLFHDATPSTCTVSDM